ncbi:hypothetical protein E3N88_34142 [Mikania micrantha]|uniref:Uncharacterized protein n=1 Tax=Mikania micrantha TaxID=192012 RepID=A0A5N6MES8_9ASTR|nr:hypothetical protein E3N88_34142 [Mikania micrantha]
MAVSSQLSTISELEPWRDLRGTVVMVTGASSGIGWELCIDLARSGCKIIAAARRIDRLKALCEEINSFYTGDANRTQDRNDDVFAVAVELDVSADGPTIEASVMKSWDAFGRIDALINNAGIRGPVHGSLNLSEEDWDKTYTTNLKGSWLVSKYVGLKMLAVNQGGSIINISSTAGVNRGHLPLTLAYSSSKSAMNTMTKGSSCEKQPLVQLVKATYIRPRSDPTPPWICIMRELSQALDSLLLNDKTDQFRYHYGTPQVLICRFS